MRKQPDVSLYTLPQRVALFVRGEPFVSYLPEAPLPGFSVIYGENEALVSGEKKEGRGMALCIAPAKVNGENCRIASETLLARRGSQSVGFQHTCAWLAPDGRRLLTEVRTVRALPGPAQGRILDLTLDLYAPDDTAVTLSSDESSLVQLQAARTLTPEGGGQFRNSVGEYQAARIHGQMAAWCAALGVVNGETVGMALLNHPANPLHPTPWTVREDGLLSPGPLPWQTLSLRPGEHLPCRYRLLVHRGYVDQGWASERLQEFAQTRPPAMGR